MQGAAPTLPEVERKFQIQIMVLGVRPVAIPGTVSTVLGLLAGDCSRRLGQQRGHRAVPGGWWAAT